MVEYDDILLTPCYISGLSEDDKQDAVGLVLDVLNHDHFMESGYRNDQAVNLCIGLHVLGFDVEEWLNRFFLGKEGDEDVDMFLDHCHRVIPYLEGWGERGTMQSFIYRIVD